MLRNFIPGKARMFMSSYDTWYRLKLYRSFLSAILSDVPSLVADIGGGEGGLEQLAGLDDIIIIDINPVAVNRAIEKGMKAILANGSRLDIPDNYFDFAVSFHTLEHVEDSDREQFINEMIRVSRHGIFMNFPCGEYAHKIGKNYLDALSKRGLPPNLWTVEHLQRGLPGAIDITRILKKQSAFSFTFRGINNYTTENLRWRWSASRYKLLRIISKTILPVLSYTLRHRGPFVEALVVASDNAAMNDRISSSW